LLRAEAIALHAAGPAGGAQHYVTCYQLTVTGSGTLEPKGVTFPAAYSKTGPGLGFSIHAPLDSYPMPGPELIASGTEATPQLLTFGKISGSPATGGGASKPASSSKAATPASSTAAAAPASPTAVAGASTTSAGNSTTEPTPIVAPVESSSAPALTPPVVSDSFSTTLAPVPSTLATSVRPKPTEGASAGSIKEFAQCGGSGFQAAGSCAAGLECHEWNPYYSQCIKSEGGSSNPTTTQEASAPSATAPAQSESTKVAPTDDAPAEKTYTLETFVAWLEENADSASAAMIRRMIEALQ
jgi:cellulase